MIMLVMFETNLKIYIDIAKYSVQLWIEYIYTFARLQIYSMCIFRRDYTSI